MRKIIASVLVFGLALSATAATPFTPPALPYEEPTHLAAEFVPQYDPPPPPPLRRPMK